MVLRKITDADMEGQGLEALKSGIYKEQKDYVAQTADALVRTTVKTIFNELVDNLESITDGESGADFVKYYGVFDTTGLGISVKEALVNAKTYMDALTIAAGAGDMLKSVFATNGATGVVDTAKNAIELNGVEADLKTGWVPAGETFVYSSVDNPTGVIKIVGKDVTANYKAGMRLKFTNGGNTIYGIISKDSAMSGSDTAITFLHEINPATNTALYIMANSAITNPYISVHKAPTGFPLNPDKWAIKVKLTSNYQKTSAITADTWYLIDAAHVINIPIGIWNVEYSAAFSSTVNGNITGHYATLSTANNSESDADFTAFDYLSIVATITSMVPFRQLAKSKKISLTTKATYYLLMKGFAGLTTATLRIDGAKQPIILRAECAYL